jgi:ankyrin repeat protein
LDEELCAAARDGKLSEVQKCIHEGADVNAKVGIVKISPLQEAAREGKGEVVKELFENGSNLEYTDMNGMTALHWAAQQKRMEVVRILLGYGAIASKRTRLGDTARDLTEDGDIQKLLDHPPSVHINLPRTLKQADAADGPTKLTDDRKAVCKDFKAHVECRFSNDKTQPRDPYIYELIYNLKDQKEIFRNEEDSQDAGSSSLLWRWIHLPANNVCISVANAEIILMNLDSNFGQR